MDRTKVLKFLERAIEFSLWMVVFSIPISIAMTNIGIVLAIILWLIKKIMNKDWRLVGTPINIFLILLILVSLFSLINSIKMSSSIGGMQKLFKGILLFFIIVETIKDRKKLRRIVWAALLGLVLVSVDGVFQYLTGKDFIRGYKFNIGFRYPGQPGLRRLSASMHNPNDFSSYLVTVIPLAVSMALYYLKGKKKLLLGLVWLIAFFCMFQTYSRGAILAFTIVMVLFSIIKKDKRLAAALLAMLLILPFLLPRSVVNWSVTHLNPYEFFVEVGGRRWHWQAAINMIKTHPFLGVGTNTFSINYESYKIAADPLTGWYAHNAYLQLAAEIGILGLAIFLLMLLVVIRNWWRHYKGVRVSDFQAISLGIFGGFISYLIASALESNLQYSNLAVLFWAMLGLIIAVSRLEQLEKS